MNARMDQFELTVQLHREKLFDYANNLLGIRRLMVQVQSSENSSCVRFLIGGVTREVSR